MVLICNLVFMHIYIYIYIYSDFCKHVAFKHCPFLAVESTQHRMTWCEDSHGFASFAISVNETLKLDKIIY